jgi:hypothetical protein
MNANPLERTEALIKAWSRVQKRTRDPVRQRLAQRVLRTLRRRYSMLADRAEATPTIADRPTSGGEVT